MTDAALTFPFDQYQRYRIAERTAGVLRKEFPELRVLDIGGYLGYPGAPFQENVLPVTRFFTRDHITVVDHKPFQGGKYIRGDGRALPVKPGIFDLVMVLDTLEHVPRNERFLIVHEAVSASRGMVIVANPVAAPETVFAEKLLAVYLEDILKLPNPALREHLDRGLPGHEDILEIIGNEDVDCHFFPYGNVYRWLEMMILKHYLISRPNLQTMNSLCDHFYNLVQSHDDMEPPCYRNYYVLVKKPFVKHLKDIQRLFPESTESPHSPRPHPSALLRDILLQANINDLRELETALMEKDEKINELQKSIILKEQHIRNLEQFKKRVQKSPFYRAYTKIKRIAGLSNE